MGDVNAVSKVFEKANIGAAIAMIQNTDALDDYTKGVQNTTSAQDQAKIVMESYEERMKRQKARLDDMKIGFFNATESMQPYIMGTLTAAGEVAKLGAGINALTTIFNNDFTKGIYKAITGIFKKTVATTEDTVATGANATTMGIGAVAARIYTGAVNGIRNAMAGATTFTRLFGTAIKSIPVIGWIAAAIGLAVVAFEYLWEHSRKFREVLFGIWEAAKAVFHNIGLVVTRVWNTIIKPIASAIYEYYKFIFTAIWNTIKTVFNAIVDSFVWLYNTAKNIIVGIYDTVVSAFNWIYDKVASVFNAIAGFFSGIWKWFSDLFKGFIKIIQEWIIDPIKNAFNGLMDFLLGIFNWIGDKLKALIQPLIDMYNYIFGSDGMENVNAAYEKGVAAGDKSFDTDHQEKKAEEAAIPTAFATNTNFKPSTKEKGSFQSGPGAPTNKKNVAAKESGNGSAGGGKTIHSLTINKLVETLVIHTTNIGDTKEKIRQSVSEALLTSVNDFNLAGA
jgi:phage-related protein